MAPPVASASKNIHPKKLLSEIIIEHKPGADFSLNNVPNNSPKHINIIADGMSVIIDKSIQPIFKSTSVIMEIIILWKKLIIIIGSI